MDLESGFDILLEQWMKVKLHFENYGELHSRLLDSNSYFTDIHEITAHIRRSTLPNGFNCYFLSVTHYTLYLQ